jgi:hypothetical protein
MNKIRAEAETATTPPAAPPAMSPTLGEEPPELGEGDEVDVEEWVEAVDEEDRVGVEAGTPIIMPGPTSGLSEKEVGSVR